jgi:hypothetical protein
MIADMIYLLLCTQDGSVDDEYYEASSNHAKKKGFNNAIDFLQSRGIPLTVRIRVI